MKKTFATIIALSSVGLLLGGLIFLGISAFPELLESEEETQEKESRTNSNYRNNAYGGQDGASGEPVEGGYVIGYGGSGNNTNVSDDVEIVTITPSSPSHGGPKEATGNGSAQFEGGVSDYDNHFYEISLPELDNSLGQKGNSAEGDFSLTSSEEIVDGTLQSDIFDTKTNKVNFFKMVGSNQAVVTKSLIIIGVVDIISVLLVQNKKHILRK